MGWLHRIGPTPEAAREQTAALDLGQGRTRCAYLIRLRRANSLTGFGRTGPVFACEHEGIQPDLMTLAKGLTSGYAPMGAVLMADRLYS